MNQVFICTDKGEYYPGESVCGVIYLEIRAPTEACGVQLSFKGTESACCECEVSGQKTSHKASHNYVDYCNTDLYRQTVPFALGHYCFPFRLQLPQLIPGTFSTCGGKPGNVWSVSVAYQLQGNVIGAEELVAEQDVVVRSIQPEKLRENHLTQAQDMQFPPSRIFGKKVHVTVKPLENAVKTGECLHLRIVITNKSPVQSCAFSVKLVQMLKLTLPVRARPVHDGQGDHGNDGNTDFCIQRQLLTVADQQHTVIREMTGSLSAQSSLSSSSGVGFDNMMIPLKTQDGRNIIPSVNGKFIQCHYCLEVSVRFGENKEQSVTCDIGSVLPADNIQWSRWRPQQWMRDAEVKLAATPITPSDHLLESEAFSTLPPFQEL